MRRKKTVTAFIILLMIPITVFLVNSAAPGHTTEITDDQGRVIPGSIAVLESVSTGGMDQSILIRGYDQNNPVLLWLHGGPGSSQMPIAQHYDTELEKEFIMVHWDQRGSGKSNPAGFDEQTMSYEQFIADGHQLTEYLKERFQRERIILLGHSWGTQLGLELVNRYPGDYSCYIGVSQLVNNGLHARIAFPWLVEQIIAEEAKSDLKKLARLGDPPYTDHESYVEFVQLIDSYGGGFDLDFSELFWIALKAPEYTLGDYLAWLRGASRGSGPMWNDSAYRSFNAVERVPSVDVAVFFFSGKNDYNTPLQAVSTYYDNLYAPEGKELIIFEESAHTPFLGQPEKFTQELIRIKEKILD